MGVKHKKTRKEKIIADYRHNIYSLEQKNITPLNSINNFKIIKQGSPSYSYVLHDVTKTGILTLSIVVAELLLFFLLRNHVITLPMIRY